MRAKGKVFFDFIVFSNLFIACCAVAMCLCTVAIFDIGKLPADYAAFVFFSTLSSYSIHWYLTNADVEVTASRTDWLKQHKRVHAVFFLISAIGSVFFLIRLKAYWLYILPAVGLTLMYTAPKFPHRIFRSLQQYILGKTLLLAAMWTYVTTALTFFIQQVPWQTRHYIYVADRFALIFAICILFDLRDKQFDKQTGVKSLVTILPLEKIKIIFTVFILVNITGSYILYTYTQDLIHFIFLALPAVFTYLLYPFAIKSKNDYLFYFILDGLMALTSVLYFMKTVVEMYIR